MTMRHGLGTYGNAVGTVTPLDHKLDQAGLVYRYGAVMHPGVFWSGQSAIIVSGAANMSYNITAFDGALTRGATAGVVLVSNDATVNVATTTAPGSNSRIDVVYAWQREFSLDGTDSEPVLGVVQGTSAPSPTVPSLAAFPGAIALAQIIVPTGTTATNTGTTITQTFPCTAARGGRIAVPTFAMLTYAFPTPQQDEVAWVAADGFEYTYYNTYNSSTNPTGAKTAGWYPSPGSGPYLTSQGTASITFTTTGARFSWATPQTNYPNFGFTTANGNLTIPYEGLWELHFSTGNAGGAAGSSSYWQQGSGVGDLYAADKCPAMANGFSSGSGIYALDAAMQISPYGGTAASTGNIRLETTFCSIKWIGVRQT